MKATYPALAIFTASLLAALLLTYALYYPGLGGPWLVDDGLNLGSFLSYPAGLAPYTELIFGNISGPLGRPVSMATFAINHLLDRFDTPSLKMTNLLIHQSCGLLLFWLIWRLNKTRPLLAGSHPALLPAVVAIWWMLLPLHVSTVLYLVQRMTLLASFFSLACCLAYSYGRSVSLSHKRLGLVLVSTSLLVLFPLAVLSKESAFVTLPWLILIELFFFAQAPVWRMGIRKTLAALCLLTVALMTLAVIGLDLDNNYLIREFTLQERLLTQGRVIATYISDIFIPSGPSMGLFHDDITISHNLLSPITTLPALAAIAGLTVLSIQLSATRWWPVAFGCLFYLSGHLVESTIVPLELYFEHRNYLPSAGLLLATTAALMIGWPRRQPVLLALLMIYLTLLGAATSQRSHIWGSKPLLLQTSAQTHPHSLRAWTDYPESLLESRQPRLALEAALLAATNNPANAGIHYLHMISIYCRIQQPVPSELINRAANALSSTTNMASSMTTPLSIGLDVILTHHQNGNCQQSDFQPLASAFTLLDSRLRQRYQDEIGQLWFLRLTFAEWLLSLNHTEHALGVLTSIWSSSDHDNMPMVGLKLAEVLVSLGKLDRARETLSELELVTHDAPPDIRTRINRLQHDASGEKRHE